jgi:transposase
MAWRPARLTRAQLEERRLAAGRLLRSGTMTQAEVAREAGVHPASVTRWKHQLARGGLRALRRRAPPGRASHLTPDQWAQLLRVLRRSAVAAGFETERWTQRRIAAVVERLFGVRYHFRSLGRALRARGWSPQVPIARARERDDALVEAWLRRDWPRVKKMLAAPGGRSSSSTRRATASWRASAPPGRRSAARPSCGG